MDILQVPSRRKRRRPQRRFMDVENEDMQRLCVTEEDAREGVRWRPTCPDQ